MGTEKLEYIATADMNCEEIKKWEKDHDAVAISLDDGSRIEFYPTYVYTPDKNGLPIPGSKTPKIMVSMCNDDSTEEISGIISMRSGDIRKLRYFLDGCLCGMIDPL